MSDLSITESGRIPTIHAGNSARLEQAARQFEASFIDLLMKDLERQPIDEEPMLGNDPATQQFKGLFYRGISEQSAGGLGIADIVMRELSARAELTTQAAHKTQQKQGG
jgi:Rod binding domain-containing protein